MKSVHTSRKIRKCGKEVVESGDGQTQGHVGIGEPTSLGRPLRQPALLDLLGEVGGLVDFLGIGFPRKTNDLTTILAIQHDPTPCCSAYNLLRTPMPNNIISRFFIAMISKDQCAIQRRGIINSVKNWSKKLDVNSCF